MQKRTKVTIWVVLAVAMGVYYLLAPYAFPWPEWWGYGFRKVAQPQLPK
jgi:hypothetical protein